MKRFVFILSIVCLLFGLNSCKSKSKKQTDEHVDIQAATGDNSRTSVDWDGTYFGLLPCADCPGIETSITLKKDHTYQLSWKYRDRGDDLFQASGTFRWNADGNIITLGNSDNDQFCGRYKVGENHLLHLDMDGNVITGELAQNYRLNKVRE